eukprot:6476875-Amphidinium_carterae.2
MGLLDEEKAANVKQEGGDNDEEVGAPPEEALGCMVNADLSEAKDCRCGRSTDFAIVSNCLRDHVVRMVVLDPVFLSC